MGLCESVENVNEKNGILISKCCNLRELRWKDALLPGCHPALKVSPTMPQKFSSGGGASSNATSASAISESLRLGLTEAQKCVMQRFWLTTISVKARDIFHHTMLFCIEASPKLNEIIACGRYCFRDLTKWPKLNRLCQAQYTFFERCVVAWSLDEERVREASLNLGRMHARYAVYGLKPHFLDIYQQQFIGLIQRHAAKLEEKEKNEVICGFTLLTGFIIDAMNVSGQMVRQDEMHNRMKEPTL